MNDAAGPAKFQNELVNQYLNWRTTGHHPARASKATMSKTADRVLGVHGFVTSCERLM